MLGDIALRKAKLFPKMTLWDSKRLIGRKVTEPEIAEDIKLWPFDVVGD